MRPLLRTGDLEAAIAEHGPDLAVLLLGGVNFATGEALDIERLTAAGHAAGALVLWDLAHAAGNVELTSTTGTSMAPRGAPTST